MMSTKRSLFAFMLLVFLGRLHSAVIPADNAVINYTRVYFEEEMKEKAVEYELLVFRDSVSAESGKAFYTVKNSLPYFWVNALEWDRTYYWQVRLYITDQVEPIAAPVHRFRIKGFTSYRHDRIKVDVLTNKEDKNAGGLICLDYSRSIYNRKGEAVWTLPNIPDMVEDATQIRDLQMTGDHTITFLTGKVPVEVDLNGKVLWRGPAHFTLDNDTLIYHHDFRKTSRGTYMVLMTKRVYRKLTGNFTKEPANRRNDLKVVGNITYKRTPVDVLVEFNKEGKMIWHWDANTYLTDEDLNHKRTIEGYPNMSSHGNAFSENKAGTKIYIGFRDLSRIIKIDKKTGKVELSYGQKYPSGDARYAHGLFRAQHDANVSDHNSIFIFNNNSGGRGDNGVSSIMELRDNVTPKDCVLIWKFDLNFDTLSDGASANQGNVVELPNSNLLLCAGALNRVFEVTKEKEIVWDAFIYSRAKNKETWEPFPHYRCHWMPQITEHHFLVSLLSPATLEKGQIRLKLFIANSGNADDEYVVELYNGKKLLQRSKALPVKALASLEQELSFKYSGQLGDLSIKIVSAHSPEEKRIPVK